MWCDVHPSHNSPDDVAALVISLSSPVWLHRYDLKPTNSHPVTTAKPKRDALNDQHSTLTWILPWLVIFRGNIRTWQKVCVTRRLQTRVYSSYLFRILCERAAIFTVWDMSGHATDLFTLLHMIIQKWHRNFQQCRNQTRLSPFTPHWAVFS